MNEILGKMSLALIMNNVTISKRLAVINCNSQKGVVELDKCSRDVTRPVSQEKRQDFCTIFYRNPQSQNS